MSYTSSNIKVIELSDLIKVSYCHQGSMVLKIKSKKQVNFTGNFISTMHKTGAQFEGDLGEILALGAEILPYIDLREKWESPPPKKKKKIFFFFFFFF